MPGEGGLGWPCICASTLRLATSCNDHMISSATTLYAIRRTFLSEKVDALRRLVISSSWGCLQVPGLSWIGDASARVDLTGVAILGAVPGTGGDAVGAGGERPSEVSRGAKQMAPLRAAGPRA